jgi:hypothetical protein
MRMNKQPHNRLGIFLRWGMLSVVILNLLLVGYGLLRFPTTLTASSNGMSGLVGTLFVLAAYALAGYFWTPALSRSRPAALRSGLIFGLVIAALFLFQILYGYLAPLYEMQNAMLANVTFGGLFLLFFLAGLWMVWRTGQFRQGLQAAVWSALVGSLIWFSLLFITYYAFMGTSQEARQLLVDQEMIGPLAALVFGSAGGLVGKGLAGVRKILSNKI